MADKRDAATHLSDSLGRGWHTHWLYRMVERFGLPAVVTAMTLSSVVLSVVMAELGSRYLGWDMSLSRAIMIPALISGPMSTWTARIVHSMGRLSRRNHEIATAYRALAMNDQLTGVLNRRGLFASLVGLDARTNVILGVADIDRFKQINDVHGHEIGDQALVQVAERLQSMLGPQDILARTGGDEFVLVLHRDQTAGLPEKLQLTLDHGPAITVSLGWQQLDPADVDAALREADAKMYRAKSYGAVAI